jgi:microcompartment protein CcmK/EutM
MNVGRIVGSVVCTQKDPSQQGQRILVVQPISLEDLSDRGSPFVALDSVAAGPAELVIVVGGSSACMTSGFSTTCVDQSIIAILDQIEIAGMVVYNKHAGEDET